MKLEEYLNPPKLSIMVTTMPSRAIHLNNLVRYFGMDGTTACECQFEKGTLSKWVSEDGKVELLAYSTPPYDGNDPQLTFGAKRNALTMVARGKFVMSFDDDDKPHERFLELVLPHCVDGVDVIGYKVACYGYANGCNSPEVMEPADVSTKYDGWYNDRNGFKYVRCPHHIVPVRREHVHAIGFKNVHHGEDHEYSLRLRDSGRLKNEAYIDEFMYLYMFDGKKKKGE